MNETDFTATEPTWVVLSARPELVKVDTGQQFTTTQPAELFTDEQAAIVRATELGWSPPEEETDESEVPE